MNGSVDLRADKTTIKDQGRRGTCVACAATAAHELIRGKGTDLCIEFLHWAAKRRDGLPRYSEGTTLPAANDALVQVGQPSEATWPYDDARDQWADNYQPPQCAIDEAQQRRLGRGELVPPTAAAVREAIDQGRPVLLGIRLHATWHIVEADGQIAMPATQALDFGGHAVLVVGYRGNDLIIQNSWGSDWGDDGFAYLPDYYIDRYGIAAWSVVPQLTEQK